MSELDPTPTPSPEPNPDPTPDPEPEQESKAAETEPKGKTPIAGGGDPEPEPKEESKPYWPEDWREKAAEHVAAGDKKAYDRELKRLQRIADPAGMYGMYREAEGKLTSGKLVPRPSKDATDEEKAEFAKLLGWTEKPEEMVEKIQLGNDVVIGDDDKAVMADFAQAVHGATSAEDFMNKAANWYFRNEEEQAAQLDEADDAFRRESEKTLKEELGASFRRTINNSGVVWQQAPAGLKHRVLTARTADGRVIGDDPDVVRWLASMAQEINPAASVVEDADASGKSVEAEIEEIEKSWRDPKTKREYFKSPEKQARYRKLLETRERIRAKA